MNCFCGVVDRQKILSLISSRGNCQRSSTSRISDTWRAGLEHAQNPGSGFVEVQQWYPLHQGGVISYFFWSSQNFKISSAVTSVARQIRGESSSRFPKSIALSCFSHLSSVMPYFATVAPFCNKIPNLCYTCPTFYTTAVTPFNNTKKLSLFE